MKAYSETTAKHLREAKRFARLMGVDINAKKAEREERQAKRVINWIVGGLLVFFLVIFFGYLIMYA